MKNIYFFIGTKAQMIKCEPLISYININSNTKVTLINSGQHKELVKKIITKIDGVNEIKLFRNTKDITSYIKGIVWIISFVFYELIFKNKNLNISNQSICVVHGDTVSTLLGSLWAKKHNLQLLHLESGLTSNNWFNPFPEEIIRFFVSKISDILICFDDKSNKYLHKRFSDKLIFQASENTIFDTISNEPIEIDNELITVTLHRTENLVNIKRMKNFINLLNILSKDFKVVWYLHEPTKNSIKRFKLQLSNSIFTKDLITHKEFLNEIKKSSYVITDGGSIQEECYILQKNTLIWRKKTEREYALNNNMLITNFDLENSLNFITQHKIESQNSNKPIKNPSKEVFDFLLEENFI